LPPAGRRQPVEPLTGSGKQDETALLDQPAIEPLLVVAEPRQILLRDVIPEHAAEYRVVPLSERVGEGLAIHGVSQRGRDPTPGLVVMLARVDEGAVQVPQDGGRNGPLRPHQLPLSGPACGT